MLLEQLWFDKHKSSTELPEGREGILVNVVFLKSWQGDLQREKCSIMVGE